MKGSRLLLPLIVGLTLSGPPAALAFDTAPHADMTVGALRSEGFGATAADVARVNNWFPDLYFPQENVPHSGHAAWYVALIGGNTFQGENWPDSLVQAADRMHFDAGIRDAKNGPAVFVNTATAEREWLRLREAVYLQLQAAKAAQRPLDLLTVIGASLHPVQDFYAHTNWVEPCCAFGSPGWEAKGQGRTPTWFDVPKAVRDDASISIKPGSVPGNPRGHGGWKSDGNLNLNTAQAKDWSGRPSHNEAYMTSYFATRQWIQALRGWLGDEALWARAQRYAQDLSALRYDLDGSYGVSVHAGHWNGQGGVCKAGIALCNSDSGPGGSVVSLRTAVNNYFEDRSRTIYRRTFERIVQALSVRQPLGVQESQVPVASSRAVQASTRFVRLRVTQMRGIDLGDPGPLEADLYARGTIAGQDFTSAIIEGHDSYSFPRPNAPFAFLRPVTTGQAADEPITSLTVRVKTGDVRLAGTDDDVFLRTGPTTRFPLDKLLYDDFERGDNDTYSVPIDAITRSGFTLGDLRQVTIEKSRDGVAGGWRLSGLTLTVNGRVVYNNPAINRWLEKNQRVFTAPNFVRQVRFGTTVPLWLDLKEDDLILGDDDQGDINPLDGRNAVALAYTPGAPPVSGRVTGGKSLGGRLNKGGDIAQVTYSVDTLDTTVPPLRTPPVVAERPIVAAPAGLRQVGDDLGQRLADAGQERQLLARVEARLGAAQVAHQVDDPGELFGLEGEQPFVVAERETGDGVGADVRVVAAHHAVLAQQLAAFGGVQQVPLQ